MRNQRMKLQMNKVCDLNSISVLPPHARRTSAVGSGAEPSVLGKNHASQLQSQQSQHSFSQGVSSQPGIFSQLSQNSLDEALTREQRLGSQERELSTKRNSCLMPVNYAREESQMPMSRTSSNLMRKWPLPDYKTGQMSDEFEHRFGMLETSLSRLGMILDSVQSDIMQVSKGTKEVMLEVESIRQKLAAHDDLWQSLSKGLEESKTLTDRGFKSLSALFQENANSENLKEILQLLSSLPSKIEACVQKVESDISREFTKQFQTVACNFEVLRKENASGLHPRWDVQNYSTLQSLQLLTNAPINDQVEQSLLVPKIEMGGWKSVRREQSTIKDRTANRNHNQNAASPLAMGREWRLVGGSDEDIDGGFSCLLKQKEPGSYLIDDAKEETLRILKKARRRKRKQSRTIIID